MRMAMILLATTLLAACSDKGKPLPPATISMKVVDRSSDARHFRVTLSDGRTPQRITLPRRSRASACPGGPSASPEARPSQCACCGDACPTARCR